MKKKSRRANTIQDSKEPVNAMYVAAIGAAGGALLGAAGALAFTERKMLSTNMRKIREYASEGWSEVNGNAMMQDVYKQARVGLKRGRSRAKRILKTKSFKLKGKK